jgi:OmcA/MtrC family decaheme c-type cytochrome
MQSFRRGVVTMMAAGALVGVPLSNPRATRNVTRLAGDAVGIYSPKEKEFYLSADELSYVRPGFNITVNSVTINADRKVVVDLSFTDDLEQPLDRLGQVTPGALQLSFILAWYDPFTRHYTAYTTRVQTSPTGVSATQAGTDSGGTWQDVEVGHGIYTFGRALPENYDATKTTTVGIYATRNLLAVPEGDFDKNYFANVEYDFRPDGAAVTDVWDKLSNEACNQCHNPLAAHGGSRQDVKLCVLCHQPQTIDPDTGNTVDFKVMVHKIHRGENLPSVEAGGHYQIIGFNQGVNDYSNVVFPQDIRNCDTCHTAPASVPPDQRPTQAAVNITFPGRASCGSCHDDVNFATGENHPGLAQPDDSQCATCHRPQGDREFDASILGAHTVPYKSTQLKGLKSEILSVSNTAPGQHPTVVFKITENDGTVVSPASLGSNLNLLMGGPTTDYAVSPFRERADGATFNGTTASYTFTNAVPADATGTWAFSIEARRTVVLDDGTAEGMNFTEGAFNPLAYSAVTDGVATPRRQVVDIAKCNTCHERLALHGGQRLNTQECVLCHNPNASDAPVRPPEAGDPESIDFKRMIHRIHTGEELNQAYKDTFGGFIVYGRGGTPHDYNEVRFPGDRRDCEKCHVNDGQQVPGDGALATRLPTTTLRDWYTPMQPVAAACEGCHASKSVAAHAVTMTSPLLGEACRACHGDGAEFSVDKIHAR